MNSDCSDIDVVFATDPGFALPTAAAIAEFRCRTDDPQPPIHLLMVGFSDGQASALGRLVRAHDVTLYRTEADRLAEFDNERFNKTHVPPAALSRFFLGDHVPAAPHRKMLYLDGDTLLLTSARPLLDMDVPPGVLLMSEDQSFYYQDDRGPTGQTVRSYFADLGIDGHRGYGNSGVILSTWETWNAVASEALEFLRENLAICRYHDQSAINAVVGDRRRRLSASWNFQIPFQYWDVAHIAPPRQVHFAGAEKPWKGRLDTSEGYADRYAQLLGATDPPELDRGRWSGAERQHLARTIRLQRWKNSTVLRGRLDRRRRLFRQTESCAVQPGAAVSEQGLTPAF